MHRWCSLLVYWKLLNDQWRENWLSNYWHPSTTWKNIYWIYYHWWHRHLESVRNLGSWFDAHMPMNVHIGKICSKAFCGLYNIRQIRKFLTVQSKKTLIHAFVSSHLDYCNAFLFRVYLNINLIVYRKFRMPRLEWLFGLRNLIISHPFLSTYIGFQ